MRRCRGAAARFLRAPAAALHSQTGRRPTLPSIPTQPHPLPTPPVVPQQEEAKFKQVRTGVVQRPKDKILTMDPKVGCGWEKGCLVMF